MNFELLRAQRKSVLVIAIACLTVCATAQRAEKIAMAGSASPQIVIVDRATGAKDWEYRIPDGGECNSVGVTGKGDVLFSYRNGVRMVGQDGSTIFDFPVAPHTEAQTARLLDNDRILVGVCATPMRILELDMKGRLLKEVNYDVGIKEPHAQFRQIAKSKNGNYLVPVMGAAKVVEIDPEGELVKEYRVPASPFSIKELDNKNLMVSTGGGGVVVVDRASGEQLKTLACGVLSSGDTLKFATEAIKTKGGVMVSNWQGHDLNTDGQLIEIDDKGEVTYRFRDTAIIEYVSAFFPFETKK